jgi:glyoxylase-like metal-dependent hydrolase (beta-lactamase superfamily II)
LTVKKPGFARDDLFTWRTMRSPIRTRFSRHGRQLSEIAPDVFCVSTPLANWYLLRAGRDLTLVDAGYPGHADLVLSSIAQIGHRLQDVRAVLVTHAHVDHVGGLPALLRVVPGLDVLLDPAEVPHARREHVQQVSTTTILRRAWRPRVAAWASQAIRHGGTTHVRIEGAAFPDVRTGVALDVPGAPVPVPTPGHTSGHSVFLLPRTGVVITGDALVTGHPLSAVRGPQLLPGFFHHDPAATRSALDVLAALPADVIAPGHGVPLSAPIRRAVALARQR